MTLCIAAFTHQESNSEHIVGCCDWRIETSTISAETQLKFMWLGGDWCALMAGSDVAHAMELANRYRFFLQKHHKELRESNLLYMLRIPPQEMRRSLAEAYTQYVLAISVAEFLNPNTAISDEKRREMETQIGQQQIKAELLLMGAVEDHLRIVRYANGEVVIHDDFSCIGSGAPLAEAFLFLRSQSAVTSLAETICAVYEAKRVGELSPGVGKETNTFVLSKSPTTGVIFTFLNQEKDQKAMESQFKRFAPRPIHRAKLPPSALEIFPRLAAKLHPQSSKADSLPLPPSQESRGGSGES